MRLRLTIAISLFVLAGGIGISDVEHDFDYPFGSADFEVG
jgi:hypothetical protein